MMAGSEIVQRVIAPLPFGFRGPHDLLRHPATHGGGADQHSPANSKAISLSDVSSAAWPSEAALPAGATSVAEPRRSQRIPDNSTQSSLQPGDSGPVRTLAAVPLRLANAGAVAGSTYFSSSKLGSGGVPGRVHRVREHHLLARVADVAVDAQAGLIRHVDQVTHAERGLFRRAFNPPASLLRIGERSVSQHPSLGARAGPLNFLMTTQTADPGLDLIQVFDLENAGCGPAAGS